jgi:hypothetical protein
MQELTSSYDDLEKRMAIYLGIGALLFSSLYLFTRGADMWTYLIRGVLALTVFTVLGWAYGRWVRDLFRKHSGAEELPENVERQSRDAHAVEGRVITHSEFPEAVIPAEQAESQVSSFELPNFESPMIPTKAQAAAQAQTRATLEAPEELGDLPPPPVPSGI